MTDTVETPNAVETVVEAVIDNVERSSITTKAIELSRNKWVRISAIGVGTIAVSAGVGYFIAKRRRPVVLVDDDQLQIEFPKDMLVKDLAEDIRDVVITKPEPVIIDEIPERILTPEELRQRIQGVLPEDQEDEEDISEIEEVIQNATSDQVERLILEDEIIPEPDELINADNDDDDIQNVFDSSSSDGDWDWEKERASRNVELPYVIHEDEFIRDEMGFNQRTLTFYTQDEILADEDEVPVFNYSTATGPLRFGHGTNDSNVVHIRNEKLKAEYQILKFDGSYAEEIQGVARQGEIEADLKHSVSKFRLDD